MARVIALGVAAAVLLFAALAAAAVRPLRQRRRQPVQLADGLYASRSSGPGPG